MADKPTIGSQLVKALEGYVESLDSTMNEYSIDLIVDCGEQFWDEEFAGRVCEAGADGHGESCGVQKISFCRKAADPFDALRIVRKELATAGLVLPVIGVQVELEPQDNGEA